jgi:predicted RNase H-like HicB family nuclease
MSSLISVQTLLEYIEALPAQEQTLLFDELFKRNIIKQLQENNTAAVKASIMAEREKSRQENTKHTVKKKTLLTGNATCDIRAADRTNFGGDLDSSTYHIIIKNESDRTVSAALLGWPECKAFGETRSQALQNLHDLVNAQLAEAEIVSVKLTNSRSNNPWVRLAGKYENDPQYDEVLAHIEEYRRELDAETEAYYSQIDAAVETQ